MAVKKSELYSSLWQSCDELRGGMDASQYKDYVLVLLFVKYVSDKYAGQKDALIVVPPGGGFADMVAAKNDKEIGDKINKIIGALAEANDLKGVIDVADFNDPEKLGSGKDMQDRLTNLVGIFESSALDFSGNRAGDDDLLGDAYEYLMRHFATESGKSKGQFYTPAEVSRIMAQVIGIASATSAGQSIYDPTCGSGSLLLKAHDQTPVDVSIYGQEMDNATAALARMNMILHDCPTAEIWKGNTLSSPQWKDSNGGLKTFDFVVANPPFSNKAWRTGFNPEDDTFKRFEYGIPPRRNGDYAFLLHVLASLKSKGTGAIVMPHGVLFRGNAEADIRRELVKRGYIKGIIGLPPNLFYGTGIPACIVVLDKRNAQARKGIFMIDASRGFIKDGNKNRLRAQDIHRIVDVFTRQIDVPRYARMVSLSEISDPKNDFNLNLPRYIDSSPPEDIQDIDGHLRGGIPERDVDALDSYWKVMPSLRECLFESAGRAGYARLKVPTSEIKAAILDHREFADFDAFVSTLFEKWKGASAPLLNAIKQGEAPRPLIEKLSEEMLSVFAEAPLMDAYDVYQRLMDYWASTMQDDVYLIANEGWGGAATPRLLVETKAQKSKEEPDFVVGKSKFKSDLVPAWLMIEQYFGEEQANIEAIEGELEVLSQQLEEIAEEQTVDEGLLTEVVGDKGKITKKAMTARLKLLGDEPEDEEEREAILGFSALLKKHSDVKSGLKDAKDTLQAKIVAEYGEWSEIAVRAIVVDHKWLAQVEADVRSQLDHVSQALATRVRELATRYATPLPELVEEVALLGARVGEHLARMGAAT